VTQLVTVPVFEGVGGDWEREPPGVIFVKSGRPAEYKTFREIGRARHLTRDQPPGFRQSVPTQGLRFPNFASAALTGLAAQCTEIRACPGFKRWSQDPLAMAGEISNCPGFLSRIKISENFPPLVEHVAHILSAWRFRDRRLLALAIHNRASTLRYELYRQIAVKVTKEYPVALRIFLIRKETPEDVSSTIQVGSVESRNPWFLYFLYYLWISGRA
jgi:hypothetical protein